MKEWQRSKAPQGMLLLMICNLTCSILYTAKYYSYRVIISNDCTITVLIHVLPYSGGEYKSVKEHISLFDQNIEYMGGVIQNYFSQQIMNTYINYVF